MAAPLAGLLARVGVGVLSHRQLHAGNGLDAALPAQAGELERPMEIVPVGDGESPVPVVGSLLDQLPGMGGSFQERVVGVDVQLHIVRGGLARAAGLMAGWTGAPWAGTGLNRHRKGRSR